MVSTFGDTNYYNNLGTLLSLNGGLLDGPAYIMGSVYGPTITLATIPTGPRTPPCSART